MTLISVIRFLLPTMAGAVVGALVWEATRSNSYALAAMLVSAVLYNIVWQLQDIIQLLRKR